MPVPDLVLLDGSSTWHAVTGVLYALAAQAGRRNMPFPATLVGHVAGPAARQDFPASVESHQRDRAATACDPRAGVLTALEDFVADQTPALTYTLLPVLDGLAVLTAHALARQDFVHSLVSGIAMGPAALQAVAVAERGRIDLAAENAVLRADYEAANYRNDRLYEALRAAQSTAPTATPPRPDTPDTDPEIDMACLRASPIVDAAWYMARYPDVAGRGEDAAAHYYQHGAAEGRDPGPAFATAFYLANYPQVGQSGANPVLHYLREGAGKGFNPSPDFDTRFYVERYTDVAEAGVNPLEHYIAHGRAEGRRPQR